MARRRPALTADDIAALQPLCRFDLSARPLEWMRHLIASHAHAFAREGVDLRTADMGISYELVADAKDRRGVVAAGTGHPRAPRHVEVMASDKAWRWIETLARRHLDCERILSEGHDPMAPPPAAIIADPCLVREAARHGLTASDLASLVPVIGETVLGTGWRVARGHPRVVDAGGVQAHVVRDVGRIRLVRLGLGDVGGYEPPNPGRSQATGILTLLRTQLPETLRTALLGQPLNRLVDLPSMDGGATVRSLGRSGRSLVVRLDGCDPAARMA